MYARESSHRRCEFTDSWTGDGSLGNADETPVPFRTRHGDVLKLILGQALFWSVIGIVAGSIVSLMVTRVLVHLLFGVGPADPVTFAVIPIVLFAVTLAAGYVPARRAIKIDPLMALRAE